MEAEMRNYMRWKSSTTQLVLEKINGGPDEEPLVYEELLNGLGEIILKRLKPFITSTNEESYNRNLVDILRSAIKLDGKLNRQLARRMPQYTWAGSRSNLFHDFQFDDRIMTRAQGEPVPGPEAKVQMVITPALVRYGSIEGERYEGFKNPEVLVHAVVHLQSSSGFSPAKLVKPPANNKGRSQSRDGERIPDNRRGGRSKRQTSDFL
jgi:hypothetical protein